jgi:transcriptional regulator GlxA family with amidase domain
VNDVAAATALSRRHLERVFRDELGTSVRQELIRVRMEHVVRQLNDTRLSVRRIAETTGFTRPNHLFRAFRIAFRMSPREYRSLPR